MENLQNTNGLTIVTANYNSSKFLKKLLESILCNGESGYPLEVLIVDDSNPVEAEAAQDLCCKYGVRYLWCQGNVARKRNFGLKMPLTLSYYLPIQTANCLPQQSTNI